MKKPEAGRAPVPEGLPDDMEPEERRPARMRLIAARRLNGLTVVLDGVHDPHNISAVLRSCDSFGVQNVHLIGKRADLRPNKLITRGCDKWLSLHYHAGAETCVDFLRTEGFALWAAAPDRTARPLDELDFSRKIALVFGAERDGISQELLARCDGRYVIPMAGFSQSLNISVAAAISLYTGGTARRKAIGQPTDLTQGEAEALARAWTEADRQRRLRGNMPDAPASALEPEPEN